MARVAPAESNQPTDRRLSAAPLGIGAEAPSGSSTSRGRKRARASASRAAGRTPAKNRPVERSRNAASHAPSGPAAPGPSGGRSAARYEAAEGTSDSGSGPVPG